MAGEIALNLSTSLNSEFFTKVLGNENEFALNLNQSIDLSVEGGDIIDISMEAYTEFYVENSLVSTSDDIYSNLKSLDPKLAEKYLAVRNLLASISKDSADLLDESLKKILSSHNETESQSIEALSSLKTEITVEAEDGRIIHVEVTLEGRVSISEKATKQKDPILIDFENDGIQFDTKKQFDIDEDGKKEIVNWVSNNDGVLFADYDKNGKISNMNEMFGDSEKFNNGIEKLLYFDENNDKSITSLDTIFKLLKIEKGSGETYTMDDLKISEIKISGETLNLKGENKTINGADYQFNYKEY